jgi:hypothetical protein
MDMHNYPWISIHIHGYVCMDIHGYAWISMDIYAYASSKVTQKLYLRTWEDGSGYRNNGISVQVVHPSIAGKIAIGFHMVRKWVYAHMNACVAPSVRQFQRYQNVIAGASEWLLFHVPGPPCVFVASAIAFGKGCGHFMGSPAPAGSKWLTFLTSRCAHLSISLVLRRCGEHGRLRWITLGWFSDTGTV